MIYFLANLEVKVTEIIIMTNPIILRKLKLSLKKINPATKA